MDLTLTQHVHASEAELWRACSAPAGLAAWQADQVDGKVEPGQSLTLRWPALGASVHLRVLEVEPRRRVVLGTGELRVALELAPGQLTLTQSPLGETEDRAGFASSWRLALATLAHYLERHPRERRQTHWWVRPLRVSPEAAHVFFSDPRALGAWLTRETTGVVEEGARYSHTLHDGATMSGRVCSLNAGRDVALTWEEQNDSLVCFRTLPSPRSSEERLVALTWSYWASEPDGAARSLDGLGAAFERLARLLEKPARA
jgi:uncharacterized protein YndB with AHSA1/START domain